MFSDRGPTSALISNAIIMNTTTALNIKNGIVYTNKVSGNFSNKHKLKFELSAHLKDLEI